ncbi:MAG: hypothetical protein RL636_982 [Verrucomicrobiota bacterium]|jgi:hypothetical protein
MSIRLSALLPGLLAYCLLAAPTKEQQRSLDGAFANIAKAGERLSARDLARYALEATAAGESPAKVAQALETLRSQQELRPGHADFGNFRWYRGQPEVKDRNAVQFVCQNLLVLALAHGDKLDAANTTALKRLLTDAAQGSLRQGVRTNYTNIYLMKACNLVLLGLTLDDAALTAQGRANLKEFLTYTQTNGITEYNSTTYTGIDMDCAAQLVKLARDPQDQATGRTLLRLFWTEVAVNWFEPAQRLGGSHSRDYNYLQGIGATDNQLSANGWIPATKPDVLGAEGASRTWLAPKEWTDGLRRTLPREVIQRWGQGPGMTATHWVTKDFSLGTCGTSKAYDDKVFALQFPGDRRSTMVYFVMESRNDPYGVNKQPDSNGHNKALHLRPSLVTLQNKGRALLIAGDDTEKPKHLRPMPELQGLWSHLVFPADAQLCDRAGQAIATGQLPNPSLLFLRKGGATLALKLFAGTPSGDGKSKSPNIVYHRDGDQQQAARLTIEHGLGAHPGKGVCAFVAEVSATPDEASFKAFAQAWPGTATFLQKGEVASLTGLGLSATIDVAKNKILKTEGASALAPKQPISVNGQDIWTPLLTEALK